MDWLEAVTQACTIMGAFLPSLIVYGEVALFSKKSTHFYLGISHLLTPKVQFERILRARIEGGMGS